MRSLLLALAFGLVAVGCHDEPVITPSPDAFAVAPEVVTGISVRGPARRLEVSRGDTKAPFTYRYTDGKGGAPRSCRESPKLSAALARLMSIPALEAVKKEAAAEALAGVPDSDWVDLEVRDSIENVNPLRLRVLPPTPERPKAYAQVPRGPYFITDAKLLEVLTLDCEG